jgi:tetratricopeptide (TPR) repeat protein
MLFNLVGCGPINEWRSNSAYEKGMELQLQGQTDEAVAAYTEAITLNPLNASAFFQRGKIAYTKNDWTAASADLAEAARLEAAVDPATADEGWTPSAEAPYLAGRAYLELEQVDNALPQFDTAVKLNPQNAEAFYYRATIYLAKPDNVKAASDFDQAISLGLTDDESHRLANAYYQRALLRIEETENAISDLSEAIKLDTSLVDAYYQRGLLYAQQDELDKAIADLSDVIKLDESNVEAFFQRSKLYFKQEKLDEALADLDHVIEVQKDNIEAVFMRGMVYNLQGNASMAYTEIDQAIRSGYETAEAYYQRGLLLVGQKRPNDAIDDFGKAIELDDKYTDALFQRGKLYFDKADYANALLDFDRVVFNDPAYEGIYATRAFVYVDSGDFTSAVADLDKAIEASAGLTDTEKSSSLYFLRGYSNFQLQEMEASLADFEKTVEINAKHAAAYYNMALIYIRQGDLENARKQIELAVKNNGGSSADHAKGDILFVLKQYEEAGKAYSAGLSGNLPELSIDRSLFFALDGDIKQAISYAKTYLTKNPDGEWAEAVKAWVGALELETKGQAGFDLQKLVSGMDEKLPENFVRDAVFERSMNTSLRASKYKDDPYLKYYAETFAFTDKKSGNTISASILRLADSEAMASFDLIEIGLAPLWNSTDKTRVEITTAFGDASYAYQKKQSGYTLYSAALRNGPYGVFFYYFEDKADPQIKFNELVKMVVEQIDLLVIDSCGFKATEDSLKNLPVRKE